MPRRREIIEEYDDGEEPVVHHERVARDETPAEDVVHERVVRHETPPDNVVVRESWGGLATVLALLAAIILAAIVVWFLFGSSLFSGGPSAPRPSGGGNSPSFQLNQPPRSGGSSQ